MTHIYEILFAILLIIGVSTPSPSKSEKQVETKLLKSNNSLNVKIDKTQNDTDEIPDVGWEFENTTFIDTRRILYSKQVAIGKRPYMVYLQLTKESAKAHKYKGWLCGGVIVDAFYVLTSAACVEDADKFYIVSGTTKYVDSFDYKNDDCVCKHRRRVVWKCIPKNYKFDFQDSIKWSSNDIAIVKVDKPFKFGVQEKGCQFATDLICYNNISRELEKAGTKGWIAGWGSGNTFREGVYRRQKYVPENAKCLEEAKVCIMDNEQCAKKWAQRFRSIINQYMICTKDVMRRLSEVCDKKYANCTDIENRRLQPETPNDASKIFNVDLGRHLQDPDDYTARRSTMQGGFCENDHGGPLIVKYQGKERVIGVISACKIDPKSHSCHGPFLYTSVYKNRQFISCAIHKDVESTCRRVFRTGITHEEFSVNWDDDDDDGNDRADSVVRDDKSSDESDENQDKAVLREQNEEVKKSKAGLKAISSSEESEENSKVTEHTTTGKVKKTAKNKSEKHNKTDKSKFKKHKSKKETTKFQMKSDDVHTRGDTKDVSYESSKDENVNEHDNE